MWRHRIEIQGNEARLAVRLGEKIIIMHDQSEEGEGVDSNRDLILEDARAISQGLWRMTRLAQDAAEVLDVRIEDEDPDGMEENVEVREALERVHALSIEISEQLDAHQTRRGG
jgi:hypothetical protein